MVIVDAEGLPKVHGRKKVAQAHNSMREAAEARSSPRAAHVMLTSVILVRTGFGPNSVGVTNTSIKLSSLPVKSKDKLGWYMQGK